MSSLSRWLIVVLFVLATPLFAASAPKDATPTSALDPRAEISDVFAFRSYDSDPAPRVTLILCVDRLLEPANGPTWFPFDPDVLYEIAIDNNHDAVADVRFQFRFTTLPAQADPLQAYIGVGNGLNAPYNSPAPVPPGTPVIPPAIVGFNSAGLMQLQTYTMTMIVGRKKTVITGTTPFYAIPPNVGPRTMLNYDTFFSAGIYQTAQPGVKVFAGAVDDPTWLDLGGFSDTLNFRTGAGGGVLSPSADASAQNTAADAHSGYAVNAIAIEVPVGLLTSTGAVEASTSPAATIGVYGITSRPAVTVRRPLKPPRSAGAWRQVQRMGNPLVKDLVLGVKAKDTFELTLPNKDAQFASYFADPLLARYLNAIFGIDIPTPPRVDTPIFLTYVPPIAAPGTPPGPSADLLRLNTGVAPTNLASAHRLGVLAGDNAGYPNGRRLIDDVLDITLRTIGGGVFVNGFNKSPNRALGDGVNQNDISFRTSFPYLGDCPSGRARRHLDPGETGGGSTN